MSDVSDWLTTIGLERYAPAFEEAEIDLGSLDLLSDDDLRDIGIPLGPRRKILSYRHLAISGDKADEAVGERRQITVMFVDLVGSTNLSTRLDPEVMSDLLSGFKAAVTEQVKDAGGTVAKYLGDGVLAYFGWPKAREDAAECAIRCALRIRERIKSIPAPADEVVRCRTGIATGLAVIGGTTGSGNAREDAVAGEVLNLSARLQSLAEPDEICVSSKVRRLVGQTFEFEFAGEHELKGFDQKIGTWLARKELPHGNRFAAMRAIRAPLIGREDELAALIRAWRGVSEGRGQAVLILGDAGIGKSRLLEALRTYVSEGPHAIVDWQCSAFHQTKPLYPVIEHLARAAAIEENEPSALKLGKLRALLAAADMETETGLPLFAALLGLDPAEVGHAMPNLTPPQRRSATIAALSDWLRRISEERPLLLNLEDAHWADATTLELTTLLISAIGSMPMLTVITGRPEFASPWSGRTKVAVMALDRLSDDQCEGLAREIVAESSLGLKTLRAIIERSDGIPLFVEELSAAVLESNRAGGAAVPDSLQSSLMARLDQLGDAKRTAQLCSILGRRFARPLLAHLHPASATLLDTDLSLLVANDILYPLGRVSERRYEFKHALVRDAAYESLLLTERRRLHERCGRKLEEFFPDTVATEPELLAHHFAEASLASDAADYYERAGDKAVENAAYNEAISNFRAALAQSAKTAAGDMHDRRDLALLLKIGPGQTIIDGAQGDRVRETYCRAEELASQVDDADGRFKALWGLWYNANVGRDYERASDFAEELVRVSEQTLDDVHVLEALHCRWSSAMFRGECTGSITDATRGQALYDKERHHPLASQFGGHDPGVCAHGVAASSQIAAGHFDQATDNAVKAVALAEELRHPHSLGHALMVGLAVTSTSRDLALMAPWTEALTHVAERYNFPPQRAVAAFFDEWRKAQTDDTDLDALRAKFEDVARIGPLTLLYVALFSEELLKVGRYGEALSIIDRFVGSLKFPFGYYLAEVYRVRGACLAGLGRADEAAHDFDRARTLALDQGAELFVLRTALSALQNAQGGAQREEKLAQARSSLARIGSLDWPEIVAARKTLGENPGAEPVS